MRGGTHVETPLGDLRTVRRHHVPVHRVGYRPEPWNWTPWEYAGADGRFHGRWDDRDGSPLTGVEYISRHGDSLTLWAIYERDTSTNSPPHISPIGADPIDADDLAEAMRLHRLTWVD